MLNRRGRSAQMKAKGSVGHLKTDESLDVERLVTRLRDLGSLEAQPAWGRASARYDHMGAKLADAVLQSGVGYEVFVRPRVDRIAAEYPTGRTASGFRALLRSEGAPAVLNLKAGRKLRSIVELVQFFVDRKVETTADLCSWLQAAGNSSSLMASRRWRRWASSNPGQILFTTEVARSEGRARAIESALTTCS